MAKQNAVGVPATVDVGGTGSIAFTAGSVVFSNGSILTQDNASLFWDDTNNRLGIGTATPLDTVHIVGAMELDHTAAENDDHAFEIVCDANGFTDVKALDINYITGALAAGEDEEAILVNIDESASTGGIMAGYLVLSTAEGGATINGYETGINVNPIVHESGTFGDADSILNKAVDVTAALASGGAGAISIFVADNDTITIGDAAKWGEHEIILATGASGGGVAPTFEYSTGGAAFSSFSPADGTNGFRNSGAILWDASTLAGWATATSGLYEVRITRTRNSLSTTPIIDELQIAALTEYKWDKDGNVNLNSLTLATDLAVSEGGTGASTLTGVLTGNGTSAITGAAVTQYGVLVGGASNAVDSTAVGTATHVLTSNGAGVAPTFQAASAGGIVTAGSDSGTATGTTVTWAGTNGITTTATSATVTVTGVTATSSAIGVATFDENDFLVTAGDVTMADRTRLRPGYVENIGIDYNGGTGVFQIQGAQADLSATNPGYICLPSKADIGEFTLYEVTANQGFIDDVGASEIIGNLFGLTTGIAHAAQIPFFIYAVGNDAEDAIAFMCSRVPHAQESPAAAAIGDPGDPVADTQGSFFSFDTITEADYESNPCLCIGSFAMTMTTADDWTVSGPNVEDGIGKFQEGRVFATAVGQFGAAAGNYLLANGGTAPTWASGSVYYTYAKDGMVTINTTINGDGGTDGSGAVTLFLALPYVMIAQNVLAYQGHGYLSTSSATVHVSGQIQTTQKIAFMYNSSLTVGTFLTNSNFGNGNRNIEVEIIYATLPTE